MLESKQTQTILGKRKWLYFFLFFSLLTINSLFSLHSEEDGFILGDYSGYTGDIDPYVVNALQEAHFNTKVHSADNLDDISEILNTCNDHGLDVYLRDLSYSADIGSYYPTRGNSFIFRAYFSDIALPGILEDRPYWFYSFASEDIQNGPVFQKNQQANYMSCYESTSGNGINPAKAIQDINYRIGSLSALGDSEKVTSSVICSATFMSEYQISWNMRWDGDYEDADELCRVGIKVCTKNLSSGDLNYEFEVPGYLFTTCESGVYDSVVLTKGDFIDNNANDQNFQDFTFTLDILGLIDYLAGENLQLSRKNSRLKYFCPIVEYYDRGNLFIDTITIEDDYFMALDDDSDDTMREAITARVQDIEGINLYNNLSAFASYDEPPPPLFNAYKIVDDQLEYENHNLLTAINAFGWERTNPQDTYYNAKLFEIMADPVEISPDYYLYGNQSCYWNDINVDDEIDIQFLTDCITSYYYEIKSSICEDGSGKPFIPVVQTWGSWDTAEDRWYNIMLPPNEQQKMLMYLPLCYGADGIYTFRMASDEDLADLISTVNEETFHGYFGTVMETLENTIAGEGAVTLGCINKYYDNWLRMEQYDMVQQANEKIAAIGPILRDLTWVAAGTINGVNIDHEYTPVFDIGPITITDTGDNDYSGFIECGEYVNTEGSPYFMLVNRRSNFTKEDEYHHDGGQYICLDVNSYFNVADNQEVTFNISSVGDNYKLIDQYNGDIYNLTDSITIPPGECIFLKLCQLPIPEIVTEDITISNTTVPYNVTIESGSTLTLEDNVTFGHMSEITISDGATLIINGETKFGSCSSINVYGSLEVNGASLTSSTAFWSGILSYAGSSTIIQNGSTIENAECGIKAMNCDVQVINSTIKNCILGIDISSSSMATIESNLDFISSNIIVPPISNAIGINVPDSPYINNISITNGSSDNSLITGTSRKGVGIKIHASRGNSTLICENTIFLGLEIGILHEPYRFTSHQIKQCEFDDCINGIQVLGNGILYKIEDNNFINNEIGLNIDTAITQVFDNKFDNNITGINLANTHSYRTSLISKDYVIDGNKFGYYNGLNGTDIRVCDSSPRISNSIFKSPFGILSTNKSNVDLSYNANNVFDCTFSHLTFIPDETIYSSTIQLSKGHNDFYQNYLDFSFDVNYDRILTIDANYNWWEDDDEPIFVDTFGSAPQIIVDYIDSDPNVTFFPSPNNRYETAVNEELQGNFQVALDMYKVILSDFDIAEFYNWHNCINKVFELYFTTDGDFVELIIYYESFYDIIPEFLSNHEKTSLQSLLDDYIKKCYIQTKQYQPAADIVVERIGNSTSPVDSLFAVMQLETIYTLSEKDSINRSAKVNTKFNHLAPKSTSDFNKKQSNHWSEIYNLLGILTLNEENYEQDIPTIPILFNNYPNPFNPETTISFSIPEESDVEISIYNIRGQKVKDLVDNSLEKGIHNVIWHSRDNLGKSVSSGVYFYQLEVNGKTQDVRKCLLLK